MSSLLTRRDVIVVASVSCIYGIGSKENYEALVQQVFVGQAITRDQLLGRLVDLQYSRNDIAFERGQFRVRGDVVELRPAGREDGCASSFSATKSSALPLRAADGRENGSPRSIVIFPAKQFVTPEPKMIKRRILAIREELGERIAWFEARGKLIEAQRIKMRTEYDLEMMEEMGFCSGIENYSRHLAGARRVRGPARCWIFSQGLPAGGR
jgi:excinuclease ABC subunit B